MKPLIAFVLMLTVSTWLRADEAKADKAVADRLAATEEAAAVLKAVGDAATAKAAVPRLEQIGKTLHAAQTAIDNETRKAVRTAVEKEQMDKAQAAMDKEFNRIDAAPELYREVKHTTFIRREQDAHRERARQGVRLVETAVKTYYLRNVGTYPIFLNNAAAYLEDKNALTDPWGRPYQYDVTGAKSGGKGPDIWSLGPQSEKDAIIGNWAPKPKK